MSSISLFESFDGVEGWQSIEYYRHAANWSNRMILGDSLEVMASLAERENLRSQVQMIYLDPPDGIPALSVLDSNNAFIGGPASVYDTNDASKDWRAQPAGTMNNLQVMFQVNNGTATMRGFGVSLGGQIYEYRDGPGSP